ncbi:hypothetical protein BC830DRAFT_669217 [Chytriomyces sp. MP71]|nr:hypothetical protein BC830DRAFT_669217 [Chytriomyces sp. MP71]
MQVLQSTGTTFATGQNPSEDVQRAIAQLKRLAETPRTRHPPTTNSTHLLPRDFSNSTFEEIYESQVLTTHPRLPKSHHRRTQIDTQTSTALENDLWEVEVSQLSPKAAEEVTSRWDLAEQRFLELFFGQDLTLRSRHRHHHMLQSLQRPELNAVRSALKSSAKNVTFNLMRNLQYDFVPLPAPEVQDSTGGEYDGPPSDDEDNLGAIQSVLLTDDKKQINTSRRAGKEDGIRIVRPRTAELDPELRRRLRTFRELDKIVFMKPETCGNGVTAGTIPNSRASARPGLKELHSSQTSASNGMHGVRRMSTAARLLLARSLSSTTSSRSASSFKSASELSNRRATSARKSRESRRPLDSARTFNPPSCTQIAVMNNYVVPKHKRPLSRGVRKFIVEAVTEDSVHPKLGALAVESRTYVDSQVDIPEAVSHLDNKTRTFPCAKSLHYILHPPYLPAPGLALEPYDREGMPPPAEVFKLRVPATLQKCLVDPENLKGLEDGKLGGRIVMRKICGLYALPKCPRVGGRITPIGQEALSKEGSEDFTEASSEERIVAVTSATAEKDNIHDLNPPIPDDNTVDQVIQSMVLIHQDEQDFELKERHRKSQSEVKSSFSKMVGTMFPLDYFMDQDDLKRLIDDVLAWKRDPNQPKVRAHGLVQHFSEATPKKKQVDEIWHGGYLRDFDLGVVQFLIEWDEPCPRRMPINYLTLPDPSRSSRWLSRAEIRLDSESSAYHLKKLSAANVLRAEFESKITLTQIGGIVAPILTPTIPDFPHRIVEIMYEQIAVWQITVLRSRKKELLTGDEIPRVQSSVIAEILNQLRDTYFLSQIENCVKLNQRLVNLYAPETIKGLFVPTGRVSHSTDPEGFAKRLRQMRGQSFLIFKPAIQRLLSYLHDEMMLGMTFTQLLMDIEAMKVLIPRPVVLPPELPPTPATWTVNSKKQPNQSEMSRHQNKLDMGQQQNMSVIGGAIRSKNTMKKVVKMNMAMRAFSPVTPVKPLELTVDLLHKSKIGHAWSDIQTVPRTSTVPLSQENGSTEAH